MITLQPCGGDDSPAIQQALNTGEDVQLAAGTFHLSKELVAQSQTIQGAGLKKTIVKCTFQDGFAFVARNVEGFKLRELTIDLESITRASGLWLSDAYAGVVERVRFLNVGDRAWGAKLGATPENNPTEQSFNNHFIDCVWNGHTGSLEMLLLFNCTNTRLIRPSFMRKSGPGPAVGLWQNVHGLVIDDPFFAEVEGVCLYYSLSCIDPVIRGLRAYDCGTVIQGANVSDNGTYGATQAQGLTILQPRIAGGGRSASAVAIQLGAVDNVLVDRPFIEGYGIGMVFSDGNEGADALTTNWVVRDCLIKNCNQTNDYHAIHPAVLFQGKGGAMHGRFEGGRIYDDQTVHTQRYPIAFDGGSTWTHLQIENVSLEPAPGGVPIKLNGQSKYFTGDQL